MADSNSAAEGKPILVALDLTERSTPCLIHGCEMAAQFGQPIIVAHVVHERAETTGMYRRHHRVSDTVPMREIAREMVEEQLASFRANHDGLDRVCRVQIVVVNGVPETRIPELAERHDAGVIVMCSHHRRGLSLLLHGSVSASVMRRASCPVVVIDKDTAEPGTEARTRRAAEQGTAIAHGT